MRFFIVILSLLFSQLCYAENDAEQPQLPPITSEAQAPSIPAPTINAEIEKDVEDKKPSTDFSAKDLAVQERMANAAKKANDLVKWQNVIGIVGLIFLFFTTIFAWGAWHSSKIAAKAAVASLNIDRPWMVYSGARHGLNQHGNLWCALKWENVGRSPSKIVFIGYRYRMVNRNTGDHKAPAFTACFEDTAIISVIGPSKDIQTGPRHFSRDESQKIIDGTQVAYLYAKIWYKSTRSDDILTSEYCGYTDISRKEVGEDGLVKTYFMVQPARNQHTHT